MKIINLKGTEIEYRITKKPRMKNITLSVDTCNRLSVSCPKYAPIFMAERFIQERADWIIKRIEENKNRQRLGAQNYHSCKNRAKQFVIERVDLYNGFYNFDFKRICVKDTKTRWGSCSSDRNLNYNYRLLFLPPHLADYVVVHEICHLQELNHSKKFWDLVAVTVPDHKIKRRELRKIIF